MSVNVILPVAALVLGAPAKTTEELVMRLDDPKVPIADRVKAAEALAQGGKGAIESLCRALDGPGEDLPRAALSSLKKLGAVKPLTKTALDSAAPLRDRELAIVGLRHLRDASAAPALAELLTSEHVKLRVAAAFALTTAGAAGAGAAEAPLVKALEDPEADVRYFAAVALGALKTPEAKGALERRSKVEQSATVKDALEQAAARQARDAK